MPDVIGGIINLLNSGAIAKVWKQVADIPEEQKNEMLKMLEKVKAIPEDQRELIFGDYAINNYHYVVLGIRDKREEQVVPTVESKE